MEQRYRISGPDVIFEQQNAEILIINLSTGCYYRTDGLSSYLWSVLCLGASAREIIANLELKEVVFAEDKVKEIQVFINSLCDEGLLAEDLTFSEFQQEFPEFPDSKVELTVHLEKYEDLKSLLLVDPIHEIRLHDASKSESS